MDDKKILPVPKHFRPGDRFVALGTLPLCEGCFLKERCEQYRKGWIYEVKALVGTVEHKCKIHEGVIMGEVEEVGVPLVIPKRLAIEGATVEYSPLFCKRKNCPNWGDCTGKKHGLGKRVKVKIKEVLEDVECPEGHALVKVIGVPRSVGRRKLINRRRGR